MLQHLDKQSRSAWMAAHSMGTQPPVREKAHEFLAKGIDLNSLDIGEPPAPFGQSL